MIVIEHKCFNYEFSVSHLKLFSFSLYLFIYSIFSILSSSLIFFLKILTLFSSFRDKIRKLQQNRSFNTSDLSYKMQFY